MNEASYICLKWYEKNPLKLVTHVSEASNFGWKVLSNYLDSFMKKVKYLEITCLYFPFKNPGNRIVFAVLTLFAFSDFSKKNHRIERLSKSYFVFAILTLFVSQDFSKIGRELLKKIKDI